MHVLIAAIAAFLLLGAPITQSGSVKEAYAQYNAALNAGDFAAADAAAERAWRLSEDAEGGATKQTAVLAYNLAWLRALRNDFTGAAEPAQRAQDLASRFPGSGVSADNAYLIRSMAAFQDSPHEETILPALERAAQAQNADFHIIGKAYEQLASKAYEDQDYLEAARYAEAGLTAGGEKLTRGNRLDLIQVKGSSLILAKRPLDGALALSKAEPLLGPQTPSDRDPHYVAMLSWQNIARAMIQTDKSVAADQRSLDNWEVMDLQRALADVCENPEWRRRPAPDYPVQEAERGGYGVVTVQYDLSPSGVLEDAEVLYAVPQDAGFAKVVLKSMNGWRAETDQLTEACRLDRMTSFTFQLRM